MNWVVGPHFSRGASGTCSGLTGAQKASCHMELVKDSVAKGNMMKSKYSLRLQYQSV
ncbi:hypothetical protein glysoja_041777 [Glycine soja]|uniref:Uncharacterized protein n=1 Tax=Glycine soja TaxID=3848 RepID=A0A0B2R2M4_GLYSO|nr:hypothetical protein glysoja_041777 [Glycine soja]